MTVSEKHSSAQQRCPNTAERTALTEATIFESFARTSHSGFIAMDEHGYPMFMNTAAMEMTGFTLDQIKDRPLGTWIAQCSTHASESQCPFTQAHETLQPVENHEAWFSRSNGMSFAVRCSVRPIVRDSRLIGSILEFQEITNEHEARKAFQELQARSSQEAHDLETRTASLKETADQLETFCYTIAHDLRAPLRSQLGYANLILEDYGLFLDENARHYLHKIIAAARYQDRLTSDLLAYARVSRQELEFQPVDLGKVISDALDTFNQQIKTSHATIIKDSIYPQVIGHELTLRLAVENLVSNALKYARPGVPPCIKFRTTADGNMVRLWIDDNGIGIAPEHREQIFQIFQRLHAQDKFSGTGIGLALVRKAISRMNGTVGLESQPGHGTRFWLELPLAVTMQLRNHEYTPIGTNYGSISESSLSKEDTFR